MNGRPGVFIDRDGTLIEERGYLADPDLVTLIPGAVEALTALKLAGLPVVIVTNQSGIARELFSLEDYHAVARRLVDVLEAADVAPARVEFCPHHPEFSGPCECRKPGTEMYRRAAKELGIDLATSFYVGDRPCDVQVAEPLGGTGVLVRTGYGRNSETAVGVSIMVVSDLRAAVEVILPSVDPQMAPE